MLIDSAAQAHAVRPTESSTLGANSAAGHCKVRCTIVAKQSHTLTRRLNSWRCLALLLLLPVLAGSLRAAPRGKAALDYAECLFGPAKTLQVHVAKIDRKRGIVECSGCDSARPRQPFTWDWGDGKRGKGFFPQAHSYRSRRRNYLVTVKSHYARGKSDTAQVLVRFRPLSLPRRRVKLAAGVRVLVPSEKPQLRPARAPYGVSPDLTVFDDSSFQACTRETVASVLSLAAAIQLDLVNDDVCRTNGRFEQVVLRDPSFRGMYALWYTEPVCFAVGGDGFSRTVPWSSFLHEMGHNFTLNSPARHHYGGKTDGCANAIFSETLAQIFQHATAYELVKGAKRYRLGQDVAWDIALSALASIRGVRKAHERYIDSGCPFASWNDPKTRQDETFDTFMTLAYKFFVHAEKAKRGYRRPVKRMMALLQRFDADMERQYDAKHDTMQAEAFRSTLLIAALSHAFRTDLRNEFRKLRFPIQDRTFQRLLELAKAPDAAAARRD